MNRRQTVYLASVAAIALAVPLAHAQEAQGNAAPDDTVRREKTIVVTAQKREQRLQDVPIAITAIDADKLEAAAIDSTADLTRITPGLVFVANGAWAQPSIRGVGTKSSAAGDSANVATYVDGVYLAGQQAGFFDFNNIERIEVLKGPQGTLYGRNATGGAINIITRDPSSEFSGEASAHYGSYNERGAKLYVTGPLSSRLNADLALVYAEDDGYTHNATINRDLPSKDNIGARTKFLFNVADNFDLTFAVDYQRYKNSQGYAYISVDGNNSSAGLTPIASGPGEVTLDIYPYLDSEQTGAYIKGEWDLGDYSLTSIASYRYLSSIAFLDTDTTALPLSSFLIDAPSTTWTQEVYASSNYSGAINWTVGLFALEDKAQRDPNLSSSGSVTQVDTHDFALAPYGELYVDWGGGWSSIFGVRYSYEEKDLKNSSNGTPRVDTGDSWADLTYRLTLQYEVDPDLMFYGTHSTGFKSGVYNSAGFDGKAIDPETIDAFELGMKSTKFGPIFNLNAFYYKYDDIQIQKSLNVATGAPSLENAAAADILGLEFEVSQDFGDYWQASIGGTLLDTEFTDFPDASVLVPLPGGGNANATQDVTGQPLLRAPDVSVNANLSYDRDYSFGRLGASGTAYYSSEYSFEPAGRVKQDAYTTLGFQVYWQTLDDRYRVSVFGSNITEEEYFANVNISTRGDTGVFAAPAEFGIRLTARFN